MNQSLFKFFLYGDNMAKEDFLRRFLDIETGKSITILRCIHEQYEVKECDNCGKEKGCYDDEESIKRLFSNMCYMKWGEYCNICNEC